MLTIVFQSGFEQEWHVKEKIQADMPMRTAKFVTEVTADGHELEWITNNFDNLPCPKNPVVSWYGDLAKMIFDSLPKKW
jgi:hypothetical protein